MRKPANASALLFFGIGCWLTLNDHLSDSQHSSLDITHCADDNQLW
ncbi:MAG: hypothetical protein KDE19_10485 [Caldilineaceae bacterium]|nr:hypothetical protein [Caldilineaceae bacterium]